MWILGVASLSMLAAIGLGVLLFLDKMPNRDIAQWAEHIFAGLIVLSVIFFVLAMFAGNGEKRDKRGHGH